jgi:hypothetical protein
MDLCWIKPLRLARHRCRGGESSNHFAPTNLLNELGRGAAAFSFFSNPKDRRRNPTIWTAKRNQSIRDL